jgi:hypothetical protein
MYSKGDMQLPISPSNGGINVTSNVKEIPLPNSRNQSLGSKTITSDEEEMTVSKIRLY